MWGGSISTMLGEEHPTIRAINPRTWIHETDYPGRAFRPSLRAYTRQREELLGILERLPPEGWSRDATFAGAGSRWSAPCSPKRSGSLCTNGPI